MTHHPTIAVSFEEVSFRSLSMRYLLASFRALALSPKMTILFKNPEQ
jgi:hypothetical protein